VRYLLDTHAFLWWIADDRRLSSPARAVIEDPDNEIHVSAVSAWEIAIKAGLGRITFQEDPARLIPAQLAANGFVDVPIESRHALGVLQLPLLHRDPFDRLLVAQALAENLPILTADPLVSQYPVPTIW